MGKSERGNIEELELSVSSILNGESGLLQTEHPWANHDSALARRISKDFPNLDSAIMVGNTYATRGDLILGLADGSTVQLELKASASNDGRGTAANISQDALTTYGLVPKAKSWSETRLESGFDERVIEIMDRHPEAKTVARKDEKGRLLRDRAKDGDELASQLITDVKSQADLDRKAYLRYLLDFPPNEAAVRLLAFAVLTGNHTAAQIEELVVSGIPVEPEDVPPGYGIYFSNCQKDGTISVAKLDREEVVQFLSVDNFSLELGNDAKATSHINGELRGESVVVLNFILHWKNVFLGIKTPCINVFLGNFVKGLIY